MTGPPTIKLVRDLDALEALSPAIEELALASRARAFDRPGFLLPLARAAATEGQHPFCMAAFRGNSMIAFLPLFARLSARALFGRRLGAPRFGDTPSFELLTEPGENATALTEALARFLLAKSWVDQRFPKEPEDSRLVSTWAEVFRAARCDVVKSPGPGLLVASGAFSGDDYIQSLPGKSREAIRRSARRLAEKGEIERFERDGDLDACIADINRIVAHSWKDSPRMRATGHDLFAGLIRNLVPDGTMQVAFVRANGVRVAVNLVLVDGGDRRSGYFSAQESAAGKLHPGINLAVDSVKRAFDEGAKLVDFWNDLDYAKKFATGRRQTVALSIARRTPLNRLRQAVLSHSTAPEKTNRSRSQKKKKSSVETSVSETPFNSIVVTP